MIKWVGPTLVFLCACGGPAFSLDAPLTLPLDAVSTGQADDSGAGEAGAAQDGSPSAPEASTTLDAGAGATPEAQVSEASLAPLEASTPLEAAPASEDASMLVEASGPLPTSCSGLPDGAATLALPTSGKAWTAWCFGGSEYLTLGNPSSNYGSSEAGGYAVGTTIVTTYDKLRFYPETLQVDIADMTFATSTGMLTIGGYSGGTVATMQTYATATSCTSSPSATASVNLAETPFTLVPGQFTLGGYQGVGTAVESPDDKTVKITGGGFCGWNGPATLLTTGYLQLSD